MSRKTIVDRILKSAEAYMDGRCAVSEYRGKKVFCDGYRLYFLHDTETPVSVNSFLEKTMDGLCSKSIPRKVLDVSEFDNYAWRGDSLSCDVDYNDLLNLVKARGGRGRIPRNVGVYALPLGGECGMYVNALYLLDAIDLLFESNIRECKKWNGSFKPQVFNDGNRLHGVWLYNTETGEAAMILPVNPKKE